MGVKGGGGCGASGKAPEINTDSAHGIPRFLQTLAKELVVEQHSALNSVSNSFPPDRRPYSPQLLLQSCTLLESCVFHFFPDGWPIVSLDDLVLTLRQIPLQHQIWLTLHEDVEDLVAVGEIAVVDAGAPAVEAARTRRRNGAYLALHLLSWLH